MPAKRKIQSPLACKTDRIDAQVLAVLSHRDLVPAIWLTDPRVRRDGKKTAFNLLQRFNTRGHSYEPLAVELADIASVEAAAVEDLEGAGAPVRVAMKDGGERRRGCPMGAGQGRSVTVARQGLRVPERYPADSRELKNTGGAPTGAPISQVLDVLIATTGRSHEADDADFDTHPPATDDGRPFDLGEGVRLDRLAYDDAELVMNACMPRGHFFFPTRQYGQRYAYIYEPAERAWHANYYGWDPRRMSRSSWNFGTAVL